MNQVGLVGKFRRMAMNTSLWTCVGLAISLAATPAFAGVIPTAEPAQRATIADIIERSGGQFDQNRNDYDILLTALRAAGLTSALDNPSSALTLIAPNDAAFIATAHDLGFRGTSESAAWQFLVTTLTTLGGGDPIPTLTNILLYHVAPERLTTRSIFRREARNETIPTLLKGAVITPRNGRLADNDPDFANPELIAPRDVLASNGFIQTINRVLLPINITLPPPPPNTFADILAASGGTFDKNNADFDILLTAVQTASLVDELQNPTVRWTVFAPTDAAFIATARDLGFTGNDEAGAWQFLVETFTRLGNGSPIQPLTNVLLYHILPFQADDWFLDVLDEANLAVRPLFRDAPLWFNGLEVVDFANRFRNPTRTVDPVSASNGNIFPLNRVLLPFNP
jgi:serralysin